MTVFDDLGAEQERLAGILGGLDDAQWLSASGAAGWTIADVVLHLAQSEESVVVTVSGGELRGGLGQAAGGTVDERVAFLGERGARGAGRGVRSVAAGPAGGTGCAAGRRPGPAAGAGRPRRSSRPGTQALTAESLREFCRGQLAHYKIPRYVHIVDEFPMTVTGKVRKVEMRERAVEILGRQR